MPSAGSFLQVHAAGKAGLDKTCQGAWGAVLSVPHTCLISLLPGPGPREQVWSQLEEGTGQLGLDQYQGRQPGSGCSDTTQEREVRESL